MNAARELMMPSEPYPLPAEPAAGRRFLFRGQPYIVRQIGPEAPARIAAAEGAAELGRFFAHHRWGGGVAVGEAGRPDNLVGFYALAHSGDPTCFDDTLIFLGPRARGRRLSYLLIYGGYLELLRRYLSFRIREIVDHPKLGLHVRCGFAPPVRPLVDGKVELGNFDLHAILARIESENEIVDLPTDLLAR